MIWNRNIGQLIYKKEMKYIIKYSEMNEKEVIQLINFNKSQKMYLF